MRIFIVMVVWLNYIVATIREICVIRVRFYVERYNVLWTFTLFTLHTLVLWRPETSATDKERLPHKVFIRLFLRHSLAAHRVLTLCSCMAHDLRKSP